MLDSFVRSVVLKRDTVESFDAYPFSIAALRNFDSLDFPSPVTFFVGENGSGKSTLLEAIAIAAGMNPEGGSRNFAFTTRPSHSILHEHLRIVRGVKRPRDTYFLRAESFFNVATEIERIDPTLIHAYGGVSLHEQSHGESFMALLTERLSGNGLYIFDEPEAALSPSRQMSALCAIHQLVNKNAQFIIATHSPIIMAYPRATIYSFTEHGIEPIDYKSTEHYRITRDFLNRTDTMLSELLGK